MARQKNTKFDKRRNSGKERDAKPVEVIKEEWHPRTELGKKVHSGEITSLAQALSFRAPVLEHQIVDFLAPDLKSELLGVGQSKGKFGGGKRKAFRQTQKKTKEGNSISFSTLAAVGNGDGYLGVGIGRSRETIPAREKALRNAKLSMFKIRRGSGSWEGGDTNVPHSIPFSVTGKCGSVEVTLIPAPKGTGLCIEKECQKLLKLAGINDIWSKTKGKARVKFNLVYACIEALKKASNYKLSPKDYKTLGVIEGSIGEKQKLNEMEI